MECINDAIANAYFEHFRGIQQTYKQAKETNPNVTLKNVRDWFERSVARITSLRGYNSFVANKPKQEYQADLFFLTSGADKDKLKKRKDIVEAIDANKPAILMTDVFSKYTKVVAIPDKKPETVLHGLQTLFNKMGGKPEVLYTDEEGAFLSNAVQKWMLDNSIRIFSTRGRAAFAERQIRTIKNIIVKRLAYSGSRNWRDEAFLDDVCNDYNTNYEHSVTRMTPFRARMPENRPNVKLRLEANRKMNRTYPKTQIGDKVKILDKRNHTKRNKCLTGRTRPTRWKTSEQTGGWIKPSII